VPTGRAQFGLMLVVGICHRVEGMDDTADVDVCGVTRSKGEVFGFCKKSCSG